MLTDLSAQVKKLIISLLHLLSSKEDSDQQLNKRDISSRQVGSKNKKKCSNLSNVKIPANGKKTSPNLKS